MKSNECYNFILEEIKSKNIDFKKHIDFVKKYYQFKDFTKFYPSHLLTDVFSYTQIYDMYDYFNVNYDNLLAYVKKALKELTVNIKICKVK